MELYDLYGCCGFREIHNLSEHKTAHRAMTEFVDEAGDDLTFSHVLFTATSGAKYGRAFAAYIVANKLGDLVCSSLAKNPNSGNRVQGWIWTIDPKALKAWRKRQSQLEEEA